MADPDGNEFCVLRALQSEELEAQGLVPGLDGPRRPALPDSAAA